MITKYALWLFTASLLCISCLATAVAQDDFCATHVICNQIAKADSSLGKHARQDYSPDAELPLNTDTLTIPVVVHVIHNNGPENITRAQVLDAIRILNEDFGGYSPDTAAVLPFFKPFVGNSLIRFRLAQKAPDGTCTDGIVRVVSPLTTAANDNIKLLSTWPRQKYLNIWVVNTINVVGGFVAAYAYLPCMANSPQVDGILITHSYVGSIGTAANQNLQRKHAISHEVAHFFNLFHIWGNNNTPCSVCGDDNVKDTPRTRGGCFNACPTAPINHCSDTVDNYENIMDYTACTRMFTKGQAARMRNTILDTQFAACSRNTLHVASNLVATGTNNGFVPVPCQPHADFNVSTATICVGQCVVMQNLTWGTLSNLANYQWSAPGAQIPASTQENPSFCYTQPGTYTITLVVSNAVGTSTLTKTNVITVRSIVPVQTYTESFESTSFPLNSLQPNKNILIETPANITNTWHRTTAAATVGNASVRIENFNVPAGTQRSLVLPPVNLKAATQQGLTAPRLLFDHAFARRLANNTDQLFVYVSRDCGKTWLLHGTFLLYSSPTNGGANITTPFVPNASQWDVRQINMQSFMQDTAVTVKLSMRSGGGNYLYLDNLRWTFVTALQAAQQWTDADLVVYPNPNNGQGQMKLTLPSDAALSLQLIDATGRVRSYDNTDLRLQAGTHELPLSGFGAGLAPGLSPMASRSSPAVW